MFTKKFAFLMLLVLTIHLSGLSLSAAPPDPPTSPAPADGANEMKLTVRISHVHGLYRATVAELPGCVAVAASEHEVRRRIRAAVAAYVASMHACTPVDISHEVAEPLA